jgi:hypothetical protein
MGKYLNIIRQAERAAEDEHARPRPVEQKDVRMEVAHHRARSVYWEAADGKVLGPAMPEFLARVGTGKREQFWIVVRYAGHARWVRSDRLRSKQAFETHRSMQGIGPDLT